MKSNRKLSVSAGRCALPAVSSPAAGRTCTTSRGTGRCAPSALFADGSSARPLVEGTVARGTLQEDEALFTGKLDGATVKELPFAITATDLDRGQERFNIYCAPCHDQTGDGNGMVVQRGYRQPPSFHIDAAASTADAGYIFDVITNGFGAMPDYKAQIDAARPLARSSPTCARCSLSQAATTADVPGRQSRRSKQQQAGGGHQPAGRGQALSMATQAVTPTDVPALARLQRPGADHRRDRPRGRRVRRWSRTATSSSSRG